MGNTISYLRSNLLNKLSKSLLKNTLNENQEKALLALYDVGLRKKYLLDYKQDESVEGLDKFGPMHTAALIYLMKEQKLAPKKAIEQINSLEFEEVGALIALYPYNVRRNHLQIFHDGSGRGVCGFKFGDARASVIKHLIVDQKIEPENAIREIIGLNVWCCIALEKLYSFGLRGKHFRECEFNTKHIRNREVELLIGMIADHGLEIDDALNKLKPKITNWNSHNPIWKNYNRELEKKYLTKEHAGIQRETYAGAALRKAVRPDGLN